VTNSNAHQELLPHLFRQEYAKMTAVLSRHFGLAYIDIAEDIASDTFLKASEHWAINGIPANPTGWLYTVAGNKIKDYIKHKFVFENKVRNALSEDQIGTEMDVDFDHQIISDSQLAMMFAVCNPANPVEGQISLSLQILCGFSVEEIANAFLTKRETIKKRLHRARVNLKKDNFQIQRLTEKDVKIRLDTVLKTLYLLFNEGYFSKTNERSIRKELCSEAIRLTLLLTENPLTATQQVNALLAFMCFQCSRLDARTGVNGETILFNKQDRTLWDQSLVERGNYYLIKACNGEEISKYHLEAGIAYWHTTTTERNKWKNILQLYNRLILIEYSPVTALNRAFVVSKVYGHHVALREVKKLKLPEDACYHSLLGYLYSNTDIAVSVEHYRTAIKLTRSKTEQETLKREIERLLSLSTSSPPDQKAGNG